MAKRFDSGKWIPLLEKEGNPFPVPVSLFRVGQHERKPGVGIFCLERLLFEEGNTDFTVTVAYSTGL